LGFSQQPKNPTEVGTLNTVISKVPRGSRVAPFTNCEVVITESALAIMTCHATLRPASGVMIEWFGSGNLPALRHSRPYLMTFVAGNFLMFGMTETDAKRRHEFRSS